MAADRRPLENRLREAFLAEEHAHPLRSDFASSLTAVLAERAEGKPGLLRFILPSLAAAAAIVIVAIYAAFLSRTQAPISATGSPPVSVPSGSEVATPSVRAIPLPITDHQTYVGDLAYDQPRNAIWFVGFDGPGHYAFRLDTESGHIDRWPLPSGSYVGIYVQVKVDAAGVVWITDDYQVVRFDPVTHIATAHPFSLAVPGSLSGGTSSGTWVSSIVPTDGGVLVARHHVPWLTRLDGSLREVGRIQLPVGDDGAEDLALVGGTLFLERDQLNEGRMGLDILDLSGRKLTSVAGPGGRLEVVGDRVLRHGRDSTMDVDVTLVSTDGSSELVGKASFAAVDPRGGYTLFRHVAALDEALQRVIGGRVVAQVSYKAEPICVLPPLAASCIPSFAVFGPSDVVTDRKGVSWYVTTNTNVVYRVQL